jgi:hypothetical protein
MTIITCQGCGAQVESKTHNRKWCEACHRERVRPLARGKWGENPRAGAPLLLGQSG